jgi:dipeptidyl aminopeptidase/acylaminoacyl peptidase
MKTNKRLLSFCLVLLTLAWTSALFAQEAKPQGKKVLTLDDYPSWQSIESTLISPDGSWVAFAYKPNDGDPTLHFKNLTTGKIHKIGGGTKPAFSDDSRWAAYLVELPKAEREKLEKEKKPVTAKGELLNLTSGDKYTVESASSFAFSENAKYFSVKKIKGNPEAKHRGTDLVVRNLVDGATMNIGNVGDYSFNKKGTHLAYIIDADKKAGNGLYLLDLGMSIIRNLDTGEADYGQMTWDKEGTALAVLKGKEKENFAQKVNVLLVFTGIDKGKIESLAYDPEKDPAFPKTMVLSEQRALTWSEDNSNLVFGIKEQEEKEKPGTEKIANVDVWHWKDEEIQSGQMRRAERDRNFAYSAVLHLKDKHFLRLADENMRSVNVSPNGQWGLGRDEKPYLLQLQLSEGKADYYSVNVKTGEKKLIEKMLNWALGQSPDGRNFLYFKDKELWTYNLETGNKVHLTTGKDGFFADLDDDHPYDEKPSYRPAGWTKDGKSVVMNHKFDLYLLSLDGKKAENMTRGVGEKEQIKFGYVALDPEEKFIDTSKPLLLTAYGEWTKKSGFYSLKAGGEPKALTYEDKSFGRVVKAKKADKVIGTRETFVEFPDYYVSGLDFRDATKVTEANPQQSEYAWGSRVLIDYQSTRGTKLQATLTLPADYQKGKKYPMIVYFYEKMSQRHHQYSRPTYDDRPHMSTYASNGYLILMPDIVYTDGTPGTNAMECTIPAVQKVIELGYADPKRIGLQGHSWGGYESSFLVTQTDMFACVVTGAPLTNLVSMYSILYKSSGDTNQQAIQFEQGRLAGTPWDALDRYISQSPVLQAPNIKVPFLILQGTEDGAVDWNQGLEFYAAARRLGKNVIFLSYPGEDHHLGKIENQKDFQVRMKQYFDHYLMDKPAPDWMVNGIPFLKKKDGKQ